MEGRGNSSNLNEHHLICSLTKAKYGTTDIYCGVQALLHPRGAKVDLARIKIAVKLFCSAPEFRFLCVFVEKGSSEGCVLGPDSDKLAFSNLDGTERV